MLRITLASAAALTLSACTIPGLGPMQSSTAPAAPPATAASAAATASAAASVAPTAEAVLASRTTSCGGEKAKVDLNQLVVTGDTTTVTWSITNTSKDSLELVGGIFKDTHIFSDRRDATVPGSEAKVENDLRATDGVYLVDTVNKRRYLAARDSDGICLCSVSPRYEALEAGGSIPFSATYRAIPPGVETVNVSIPGVGTFVKVPVQR